MKLKLKDAYEVLESAVAIIIDNDKLLYPSMWDLTGEDDNEFMYLFFEQDGNDYSLKFCEGDNKEVEVIGNSLFMYDTDANDDNDHTQITILIPQNLEVDKIS